MQPHSNTDAHVKQVLSKLQLLPPERLSEVENFIDFLCHQDQDRQLVKNAAATAEPSFNRIWDNPEDADYDHL